MGDDLQSDRYPPPVPPVGKKDDIFHQDQFTDINQRVNEAPGSLLLSFPDLTDYLTSGLTSDLAKLRSIFLWIGVQELLDPSVYTRGVPTNTPYHLLQQIARSDGSDTEPLSALLHGLCRKADLPCKTVVGYTKRVVDYVPGDDFKTPNYNWNAVYVDGSWRFVDTQLAFIGYSGVSPVWIMVEDSGQAVRQRQQTGGMVQIVNEKCFLPDPEDFIYFCYPEDPAWQLLQEPWNRAKFLKTPIVSWRYLQSSWHLADKHAAVEEAVDGRCCLSMDRLPDGEYAIRYRLFYNEKKSKKKFPNKLQLDNYIKTSGSKGQQSVLTRLPQPGLYKLEILDGDKRVLCKLAIRSTGKAEAAKPFPPIPEAGLGFCQAAIDAGLVDPTRVDGLVVAREGEKVRFRFRTKQPLDVVTRLVHSVLPSRQLENRLTHEEENGFLTIQVTVPWCKQNPEFSLQVDAKPKGSDEDQLVNIINYLLTSDRQLVHSIKGKEQQLREELEAAIADDDLHRLESAIREFRAGHCEGDDLHTKACNRLCDLHRSAVESAKKDEATLLTALGEVDDSHVAYLLHNTQWFRTAQEHYRRMRRLSLVKHQVESLGGKQISEIQTYNHPHAGVQAAVEATFMLLGEDKKKLKKWKYVQALLRRLGRQSVMHRIKNHNMNTVDEDCVDKAQLLLASCTSEELRSVSCCAAAFYEWSKAVIDTVAENKKDDINNQIDQADNSGDGANNKPEQSKTDTDERQDDSDDDADNNTQKRGVQR